jgi:hypothetical protein
MREAMKAFVCVTLASPFLFYFYIFLQYENLQINHMHWCSWMCLLHLFSTSFSVLVSGLSSD